MDLFREIEGQREYMVELRRHFHRHPEASLEEFGTAGRIEEELGRWGIPCRRVGETGVWGTIRGEAPGVGRVLALRADIDALRIAEEGGRPWASVNPGVMHACGHDAHAAALLGAARVLGEKRGLFAGEIRLCFQQGEEIGAGARQFIQAGMLEGAGRVFGIHVAPDLPAGRFGVTAGPRNASVDYFCITVRGRSAHVSAPQDGADALYAACQMVSALQGIVTRRTSPLETVIIGVGRLDAGTAYNIVAETAVLEGTVRTFNGKLREEIRGRIDELSDQLARQWGAERDIVWKDFASVLVNDAAATAEALEAAKTLVGEAGVETSRPRSLGGDDFAEFLLSAPGVYVQVGCGFPDKPFVPLHNSCFDLDEDALVYGAGIYAAYTAAYLGMRGG